MAFLLAKSVFVHTPKTAGQWVVAALENAGLIRDRLGVIHASPDEISDDPRFQRCEVRFTVVRHPLAWYRSMWAHQMDEKWDPIDDPEWFSPTWVERWAEFTRRVHSDSFPGFVQNCLDHYPNGFVSHLYETYTAGCTDIAHQETITEDLIAILRRAGEDFEVDRIRSVSPRNVRGNHKRWREHSRLTPELVTMVLEVEGAAVARFGYKNMPNAVGDGAR